MGKGGGASEREKGRRQREREIEIMNTVLYSGKLSREKTFTNFIIIFQPSAKVFSTKY